MTEQREKALQVAGQIRDKVLSGDYNDSEIADIVYKSYVAIDDSLAPNIKCSCKDEDCPTGITRHEEGLLLIGKGGLDSLFYIDEVNGIEIIEEIKEVLISKYSAKIEKL